MAAEPPNKKRRLVSKEERFALGTSLHKSATKEVLESVKLSCGGVDSFAVDKQKNKKDVLSHALTAFHTSDSHVAPAQDVPLRIFPSQTTNTEENMETTFKLLPNALNLFCHRIHDKISMARVLPAKDADFAPLPQSLSGKLTYILCSLFQWSFKLQCAISDFFRCFDINWNATMPF